MRINRFIGVCLVGLGLGSHTALAQPLFTNLNFESAAFPSMLPAGTGVPASQALPGWNATPNYVYRNLWLPRGPLIEVEDISLGGGGWGGAQGNFYISMRADTSPVSISQTGYLSSDIKSVRFRVWAKLTDFTISFAGQALPCVIVSSNYYYNVCAADVSRFAGTTGELQFLVTTAGPLVTLDDIAFSTEPTSPQPPQGTTLTAARVGSDQLRLIFPTQPGATYSIQTSTNLSTWTTLSTFQATSIMLYSDQVLVTNYPTRAFYRIIGPAP